MIGLLFILLLSSYPMILILSGFLRHLYPHLADQPPAISSNHLHLAHAWLVSTDTIGATGSLYEVLREGMTHPLYSTVISQEAYDFLDSSDGMLFMYRSQECGDPMYIAPSISLDLFRILLKRILVTRFDRLLQHRAADPIIILTLMRLLTGGVVSVADSECILPTSESDLNVIFLAPFDELSAKFIQIAQKQKSKLESRLIRLVNKGRALHWGDTAWGRSKVFKVGQIFRYKESERECARAKNTDESYKNFQHKIERYVLSGDNTDFTWQSSSPFDFAERITEYVLGCSEDPAVEDCMYAVQTPSSVEDILRWLSLQLLYKQKKLYLNSDHTNIERLIVKIKQNQTIDEALKNCAQAYLGSKTPWILPSFEKVEAKEKLQQIEGSLSFSMILEKLFSLHYSQWKSVSNTQTVVFASNKEALVELHNGTPIYVSEEEGLSYRIYAKYQGQIPIREANENDENRDPHDDTGEAAVSTQVFYEKSIAPPTVRASYSVLALKKLEKGLETLFESTQSRWASPVFSLYTQMIDFYDRRWLAKSFFVDYKILFEGGWLDLLKKLRSDMRDFTSRIAQSFEGYQEMHFHYEGMRESFLETFESHVALCNRERHRSELSKLHKIYSGWITTQSKRNMPSLTTERWEELCRDIDWVRYVLQTDNIYSVLEIVWSMQEVAEHSEKAFTATLWKMYPEYKDQIIAVAVWALTYENYAILDSGYATFGFAWIQDLWDRRQYIAAFRSFRDIFFYDPAVLNATYSHAVIFVESYLNALDTQAADLECASEAYGLVEQVIKKVLKKKERYETDLDFQRLKEKIESLHKEVVNGGKRLAYCEPIKALYKTLAQEPQKRQRRKSIEY